MERLRERSSAVYERVDSVCRCAQAEWLEQDLKKAVANRANVPVRL